MDKKLTFEGRKQWYISTSRGDLSVVFLGEDMVWVTSCPVPIAYPVGWMME